MDLEQLNGTLLIGVLVLLVAIGAMRVSVRLGLPTLLVYLAIGLALGESGVGVEFEDAALAHALGFAALMVILIEGGLTTRWQTIRPAVPVSALLATVGVAVSMLITSAAAHLLFDLEWRLALLAGAVLSVTDSAAVFSVLRALRLPPRLVGTLEAESGFNDAPVVLVVTLLSTATAGWVWWHEGAVLLYELGAGAALGLGIAWLGTRALRGAALPASGLYPVSVVGFAVLAYGVATALHASGFLAVYLAALVLGNADLPHRPATRGFAEGLAWLAQIGLFVMLGLLASPDRLSGEILPALGVGLVLLLVARPIAVAVCAVPFRMPWPEQLFLSWAGLRGAVPIVLATIPLAEGVEGAEKLFDLVFVLVVVYTLLQAPTLSAVARRLGVTAPAEAADLDVEAAPLEELRASLLQLQIPPRSRLHGVEVFELRLPPGAAVTLILRGARSFVPERTTTLLAGDQLLIVTPAECRSETERRLREVNLGGKLAGWRGVTGRR